MIASVAFAVSFAATDAQAGTPMIAAGTMLSCGVTVSGEGLCWGPNTFDQTNVPTGKTWKSISAGNVHACGVSTSGEGLCWGDGGFSRTTVPSGKTWASIDTYIYHSCGVTSSGEGLCWGKHDVSQTSVPTGKTWASITAGDSHSCGVTTIGEGLCWGSNNSGRATVPGSKTWASISAGSEHSCGVTTSGDGLCWGANSWGQTTVPTGKTWSSIEAGAYHSCGVTTSGEGLCWGMNNDQQTDVPTGKTWSSISAGYDHSCGLTANGEGLCWGNDGWQAYCYSYSYGCTDGRLVVPVGKFAAGSVGADTTAPDAPVLSGAPSGTVNDVTASVGFTGEADATFSCKLDSGSYAACGSSPKSLTALSAGSHTFYVTQTDVAGNESIAASVTWTVQSIGTTSPTLQTGAGGVAKPNEIKGEGYGLTGVIGTEPTPVFQWQRCTTLNDAASCAALTGVAGSTGAWWGTRDADIGYQLRLSVGWTTVQGVKNALSALSGLVAPSVTAAPEITFGTNPYSRRLDPSPVKDVRQRSSFGTWAGYIAGVSTVSFEWQTCTNGADTSTCSASTTSRNHPWYTPTANDAGKYLRTKATITTRGQTAIGYSSLSYIRATRPLCRQATATRKTKARATGTRQHKAHTTARIRAHAAC